MGIIQVLSKLQNKLHAHKDTLFSVPVEKQKAYLQSLSEPKDDIARGYCQYRCQAMLQGRFANGLISVVSLPVTLLMLVKNRRAKFPEREEYCASRAVFFRDGKPANIMPNVLRGEFSECIDDPVEKADFSGVISAKNFENGELYSGMPILTLIQINTLKSIVNIPEAYFPMIKAGTKVQLTSDIYKGRTFEGTIEIIYPTIDPNTHTFQAKVRIPNAKEELRPGMYMSVNIDLDNIEAIIVPYQSVLKLQGANERYVFINNDGYAKRVVVEMGKRFDDKIEIISNDIKEGDELVVVGQAKLVDGVKLNISK